MPGIYRLKGTVRYFDWGGTEFIPALLKKENETGRPWAEFWLGTHPQDETLIEFPDGTTRLLKDHLAENPGLLGSAVKKQFGQLPYLLKVLDVKKMLSIQVHPTKADAEKEFARENKEGIPHHAPSRNYKDDNHKPELMVALGDFWLLHGFKQPDALRTVLKAVTELSSLLPVFEKGGLKGLYSYIMEMPQEQVNQLLQPLIDRVITLYQEEKLTRDQESFWAARAAEDFDEPGKIDRGIFSIYFFNLLKLTKGEGIYQPAGLPHAYLEGRNIEIMASSDNVLRGGLTTKHIDVKELLKHVKCEAVSPEVLKGDLKNGEKIYETDAPDFLLSQIEPGRDKKFSFSPSTAEIILLVNGSAQVKATGQEILLQRGDPAAICFPGQQVTVHADADATLYKATVPQAIHSSE